MKQQLFDKQNNPVGEVTLSDDVFAGPVRLDIISRVIHWQLAKRRSGNHKSKQRNEVQGSTKKIVRQKGSGGARHGSKRAPQFRGGGKAFGPVVRDHGYSLPKKVRAFGLKSALSLKTAENNLIVVDNLAFDVSKTKYVKDLAEKFSLKSALIIDVSTDDNLVKSVSNIYGIDVLPPIGVNVYDVVRKDKVMITRAGLEQLEKRFQK